MLILCYSGHMKRTLYLLALAAAMLVSPVFAQESLHCYDLNPYLGLCEFSNGSAMVITITDTGIHPHVFTAAEWLDAKPRTIGLLHQENCEKDGFVWADDACHMKAAK